MEKWKKNPKQNHEEKRATSLETTRRLLTTFKVTALVGEDAATIA